jgi:hypothetical protein
MSNNNQSLVSTEEIPETSNPTSIIPPAEITSSTLDSER